MLENTEVDGHDEILKNATTAEPLKYLRKFWRSLEMPLISCEIELKLKWTNYCVLPAAGANVNNNGFNNIILL